MIHGQFRLINMEAVARVICEGHADDVAYLDVSKACDPLNHKFWLAKMKALNLNEVIVRWIEACLTGRVLYIGGQLSELFKYAVMSSKAQVIFQQLARDWHYSGGVEIVNYLSNL